MCVDFSSHPMKKPETEPPPPPHHHRHFNFKFKETEGERSLPKITQLASRNASERTRPSDFWEIFLTES